MEAKPYVVVIEESGEGSPNCNEYSPIIFLYFVPFEPWQRASHQVHIFFSIHMNSTIANLYTLLWRIRTAGLVFLRTMVDRHYCGGL